MTAYDPIDRLLEFLAAHPSGPISLASDIENHLAQVWDALAGDDGGMVGRKLHGRMEAVAWHPPNLVFRIERHGAAVLGSSRAEVQEWTVDLEQRSRTVVVAGLRQVQPPQPRLDVKPVAEELASAIMGGQQDPRLKWDGQDHVRLLMGAVLPAGSAVKETLAGRRKRLREAVTALIAPAGWSMDRANLFVKVTPMSFMDHLPRADIKFDLLMLADRDEQPTRHVDPSLVERIRTDGFHNHLIVERRQKGFLIFDGHDEYAAIRELVQSNADCYDARRCATGPAAEVYRTVPCRIGYFCEVANEDSTGRLPGRTPPGCHPRFADECVEDQVAPLQQPRFDVTPIAEELADAIRGGRRDHRLEWEDGRVRLLVSEAVPPQSACASTLAARRKRLREALTKLIAPDGWRTVKVNRFERIETKTISDDSVSYSGSTS